MKAHVIGLAGSGKTTLARWLADRCGTAAIDLDGIVYDPVSGERPESDIARRLAAIRSQHGWITEGAYHAEWLRPHLEESDVIVWLDLSLRTCLWRIATRHVKAELARNNPHPGWKKLWRFLLYTRRTAGSQRTGTSRLLKRYGSKVVRCRSSSDEAAFRRRSGGGPGGV
jgi:adenylate kinase family enzyme